MDEMTTAGAARVLGLSAVRIRQLIAQGALPARRHGRDWLLTRADVEALHTRPRVGWRKGRPRKPPSE